jgi:2'-5' RNA ligase
MAIAIDVALLLPDEVNALAVDLNRRLDGGTPEGLTLDADHLPHVTLAQLFVEEGRLEDLGRRIDAVASRVAPLDLGIAGLDDRTDTAMLVFEGNERLRALHAEVMDAVRGFEVAGGADAFHPDPDGRPARDRDVAWTAGYRANSAYGRYLPHVTVGHGHGAGPVAPFSFRAARLAVCRLGPHCTCRLSLRDFRLLIPDS